MYERIYMCIRLSASAQRDTYKAASALAHTTRNCCAYMHTERERARGESENKENEKEGERVRQRERERASERESE